MTRTTTDAHTPPRKRMIQLAAQWLPDRGLAAINLIEVGRAAEVSRGSLYHYFPGGREELLCEVLALVGKAGAHYIQTTAESAASPASFAQSLLLGGASWLGQDGRNGGCPVASALLTLGTESQTIREAVRSVWKQWELSLVTILATWDVPAEARNTLACAILLTFEGALLHAKASDVGDPFSVAAQLLAAQFKVD